MIRILGVFCCLFFIVACQTQRDPCLIPTDVNMRVRSMKKLTDSTSTDSVLVNLNLTAVDNDTLKYLYLGAKNISSFFVRLSPKTDSCLYLLQPDSSINSLDTIHFYYGRQLKFLSNACGYTYFFTIDSVHFTQHNIDTIRIVNRDVTTDVNTNPLEHVQIFF